MLSYAHLKKNDVYFCHRVAGSQHTHTHTHTHTHSPHLQLPPDPLNEEAPAVLSSVLYASTLYLITNTTNNVLQLVTWEWGGEGGIEVDGRGERARWAGKGRQNRKDGREGKVIIFLYIIIMV